MTWPDLTWIDQTWHVVVHDVICTPYNLWAYPSCGFIFLSSYYIFLTQELFLESSTGSRSGSWSSEMTWLDLARDFAWPSTETFVQALRCFRVSEHSLRRPGADGSRDIRKSSPADRPDSFIIFLNRLIKQAFDTKAVTSRRPIRRAYPDLNCILSISDGEFYINVFLQNGSWFN